MRGKVPRRKKHWQGFIQPQDNTFYSDITHGPPDDDTNPNRSPTQVVINAVEMVIWVMLWLPATGLPFHDDNEIIIIGRDNETMIYRVM